MTLLQQLQFCALVQIGSHIKGHGNHIMVVTQVTPIGFKGYSLYASEQLGKQLELVLLFSTIQNPHYNKNLSLAK